MTEEQKTKYHYEMLNNSSNKALVDLIKMQDNKIEQLEKEIAEIKNNNKVYCEGNGETLVVNVSFDKFTRINANHKMYYPHSKEIEETDRYRNMIFDKDEQLTKAKEIIKDMLSILPKENIEGIYEITEEAEQFLKIARWRNDNER